MRITINGTDKDFTAPPNVAEALDAEGYGGKLVAVALNGAFVPKEKRADTALNDGDALEIVAPMQGG